MNCEFQPGDIIYLNSSPFVIQEIIGRGSSCIVYKAKRQGLPTEHLLKEYHPSNIALERGSDQVLRVKNQSDRPKFDEGLSRFIAGYQLQMHLREKDHLKNSICNVQAIHEGYGTHFIEMTVFSGKSYDQVTEGSLRNLLLRIRAITQTVAAFHQEGYLLLDLKPENTFTDPDKPEWIVLFDFDSVVDKSNIPDNWRPYSTRGWYAPELDSRDCRKFNGEKMDVYSIGMILYHKLTSNLLDNKSQASTKPVISLDPPTELLKGAGDKIVEKLITVLEYTLCSANFRWTTNKLINKLDDIIHVIDQQKSAVDNLAESAPTAPVHVQVDVEVDNKVVVDHVKKQISKLHITILVAAILICIPLFFLCCGFLLSDSDTPSNNTVETYPSDQLQVSETTDTATESISNTQTEPHPTAGMEAPTVLPTHGTEESTPPSPPNNQNEDGYVIDTIAYTSENFRSLIVTNDGVVYYLDGNVVFNSADNVSLDIETILAQLSEYSYLAYDLYHDIVYLLAGESLTIYDITDLNNPVLVMNNSICSTMSQLELDRILPVAPQIPVLPDGSLLVPTYVSGTYRVDVVNKRVAKFEYVYNLQSSYYGFENHYSRVIGDYILELRKDSKEATIIPLNGTLQSVVQLEIEPPHWCEVWATQGGLLFYVDGLGVCQIQIDGTANILIPQGQITINDYQSLDSNDILVFAANENGIVAFYDYSLNGIRLISPEQ